MLLKVPAHQILQQIARENKERTKQDISEQLCHNSHVSAENMHNREQTTVPIVITLTIGLS